MIGELENKIARLSVAVKLAILCAFIVGILVHATQAVNLVVNHDAVSTYAPYAAYRTSLYNGRWFYGVVGRLIGEVTDPAICIFMGIVFIALSAGIVVSLFKVHSRIIASLIGCLMVVFPAVVSTNTYIFASAKYFFALFLATLSVYLYDKFKFGPLFSIICLTLSLGVYQAYIGFAAGLYLFSLVLLTLDPNTSLKNVIKRSINYFFVLLFSILLYYFILRICLAFAGQELGSYRGINEMNSIQFLMLPEYVLETYKKVYNFFVFDQYSEHTFVSIWLNRLLLICFFVNYVIIIVNKKVLMICKKKLFLLIVFPALIPLAIHIIAVLGQNADTHYVMLYPFVLVGIMAIIFADQINCLKCENRVSGIQSSLWKGMPVVTSATCLLISYLWIQVTGTCYTYMKITDSKVYAACVQICSDLNQFGYDGDTPIAFISQSSKESKIFSGNALDGFDKTQYTGVVNPDYIIKFNKIEAYLNLRVGFNFTSVSADVKQMLAESDQFAQMPIYPERGSISKINGTTVVKLTQVDRPYIKELDGNEYETQKGETLFQKSVFAIDSEDGSDYKCESIQLMPLNQEGGPRNYVYRVRSDNISCVNSDEKFLTVALYHKEAQKILFKKQVETNKEWTWVFETTRHLSNDIQSDTLELLIYAGVQGDTAGNEFRLNNLSIEVLDL